MPVLPLVGSMMTVSFVILPSRSAALIMATPMRSLTDHSGLKFSSLPTTVALASPTTRRKLIERRVADALRDVVVNLAAKTFRHGDSSLIKNEP